MSNMEAPPAYPSEEPIKSIWDDRVSAYMADRHLLIIKALYTELTLAVFFYSMGSVSHECAIASTVIACHCPYSPPPLPL